MNNQRELRSLIDQLQAEESIPPSQCGFCSKPARGVATAIIHTRDDDIPLPVSVCRYHSLRVGIRKFLVWGVVAALSALLLVGITWTREYGALVAATGVVLLPLAALVATSYQDREKQAMFVQLKQNPHYSPIFQDCPDLSISFEGDFDVSPKSSQPVGEPLYTQGFVSLVFGAEESSGFEADFFCDVFVKSLEEFSQQVTSPFLANFEMAVALLPGRRKVCCPQVYPREHATEHLHQAFVNLSTVLDSLPNPQVRIPVILLFRGTVSGGHPSFDGFEFPFSSSVSIRLRSSQDMAEVGRGVSAWLTQNENSNEADLADPPSWGEQEWSEFVNRFPEWGRALNCRGRFRLSSGNIPGAIEDFTRSVQIFSEPINGLIYRAEAFEQLGQFPEAEADLERALTLAPSNSDVIKQKAEFLLRRDRSDEARQLLESLLRSAPDDNNVRFLLGRTLGACGELAQALEHFNEVIRHAPDFLGGYYFRSITLLSLRRWSETEQDCDRIISVNPDDAEIYWRRSIARQNLDRSQEALCDLNRVVELQPENHWYRLERARLLAGVEQLMASLDDLDHILRQDPLCHSAAVYRGFIHHRSGDDTAADRDFTEGLRYFDDQNLAAPIPGCNFTVADGLYYHAAVLTGLERHAEALSHLDQLIGSFPENPQFRYLRGQVYWKQERIEEALEEFNATVQHAPEFGLVYQSRGCALATLDRLVEAAADFSTCIDLLPEHVPPYFWRGHIRRQLEDHEQALQDLSRVIELDPENHLGFLERAKVAMATRDLPSAMQDLEQALALNPEDYDTLYNHALCAMQSSSWQVALDDLTRLLERSPEDVFMIMNLGLVRGQLKQPEEAVDCFERALALAPELEPAIRLEQLLVALREELDREDYPAAIRLASEYYDSHPDSGRVLRLRAVAYWYSCEFVEAIDDVTALINLQPESLSAYGMRGQIYAEMGEYEAALSDFETFFSVATVDRSSEAYARSGKGLALVGLGRFAEAEQEFDASLAISPENAWLQYNLGLSYLAQQQIRHAGWSFRLALALDDPRLPPLKRARAQQFLNREGCDP